MSAAKTILWNPLSDFGYRNDVLSIESGLSSITLLGYLKCGFIGCKGLFDMLNGLFVWLSWPCGIHHAGLVGKCPLILGISRTNKAP